MVSELACRCCWSLDLGSARCECVAGMLVQACCRWGTVWPLAFPTTCKGLLGGGGGQCYIPLTAESTELDWPTKMTKHVCARPHRVQAVRAPCAAPTCPGTCCSTPHALQPSPSTSRLCRARCGPACHVVFLFSLLYLCVRLGYGLASCVAVLAVSVGSLCLWCGSACFVVVPLFGLGPVACACVQRLRISRP